MNTANRDILRQIKDKIDLLELVQEYLPLKRAGVNYQGVCPFHQESKPSFIVSPAKQIFHCFGCQVGGSVFDFLMQIEGLSFSEALKILAKRAGIELDKENWAKNSKQQLERERLIKINQQAMNYYSDNLQRAKTGKLGQYLASRGITADNCQKFSLGYAGDDWQGLTNHLSANKIATKDCQQLGLVSKSKEGRLFDRFRQRLIFPISDVQGNCLGFGGRVIDQGEPKYLNSPETPLYHKGETLYAIKEAVFAMRREKIAFVVEGYLDCIAMHGAGYENTVASLGTALSEEQVKLLKRYAKKLVFVFDGDKAGQSAALRALSPCLKQGVDPEIVLLPKDQDPDSLLRQQGKETLASFVEKKQSLWDYSLADCLSEKATPSERADSLKGHLIMVGEIPDQLRRSFYLQDIANKSGLDLDLISGQVKLKRERVKPQAKEEKTEQTLSITKEEELLICLLASNFDFCQKVKEQEVGKMCGSTWVVELIQKIVDLAEELQGRLDINDVLSLVKDQRWQRRLRAVFIENFVELEADQQKLADDCLRSLARKFSKRQQLELSRQIALAEKEGNETLRKSLLEKKVRTTREYHEKR